jgi:hypothetical protein
MGKFGGATQMEPQLEKTLSEKWAKSDLSPVVREQEPSAFGSKGNESFYRLCPEVAYDRFGWFASALYTYTDEIDVDVAHTRLGRLGDQGEKWRWSWSGITPMHYTECPTYSLLHGSKGQPTDVRKESEPEVLSLRPSWFGIGIDIKALFSRLKKWRTRSKR